MGSVALRRSEDQDGQGGGKGRHAGRPLDISSTTLTMEHSSPEPRSPGSRSPSSTPSTTAASPPSGMSVFSSSSKPSPRGTWDQNGSLVALSLEKTQVWASDP